MEFNSSCLAPNSTPRGNFFLHSRPAMMAWHRRLKDRTSQLGWSAAELSRRSQVNIDNCRKYLKGRVDQPRGPIMGQLAAGLGVSLLWLRDGLGPELTTIPIVGYVSAGETAIVPFDDHLPGAGYGELDFTLEGTDAIAIEIRGDSMLPVYRRGDQLICSRYRDADIERCVNQDCVVRAIDDKAYIKVLRRGSEPGIYTLESYNRAYEPNIDVELQWAAPIVWVRRAQWRG